jgi:hypothetical protein
MTPGLHGIVLHLRCRAVPATVLVFLAAAALTWAAYLPDDPATSQRLGLIAVVLGIAPTARTLAGPDEELERGTPAPWRLIRAVHLLLLGGVLLGLLVAVHRIAGQGAHAVAYGTVVQAVLALTALTALGAVLVGAHAAWVLLHRLGHAHAGGGPQRIRQRAGTDLDGPGTRHRHLHHGGRPPDRRGRRRLHPAREPPVSPLRPATYRSCGRRPQPVGRHHSGVATQASPLGVTSPDNSSQILPD